MRRWDEWVLDGVGVVGVRDGVRNRDKGWVNDKQRAEIG